MHPARFMPLHSGEKIAALGHGTCHFAESPARWAEDGDLHHGVLQQLDLGMTTPAQIALATKALPSCDGGVPANNASEMA